jgi:acylphosphatase
VIQNRLLYKIHVTGQVQGVGFRWGAATKAKSLDIKGYVRNLPDGSVYIEAEGSGEQLNAFVEWCKQGPGFSLIESVNIESFSPVNYSDFLIEH